MRAAFFKLHQYLNILSIDIAAGAVVSAMFFAKIFNVQVRSYGLLALGLTVWIIYTIDHLRDAKKIKHRASTLRHRFHQQHFNQLIFWLSLALILDAVTIYFIRRQVFEWGLILFTAVVVYLVIQQYLRFLKELFIATLYTAGVLLLSFAAAQLDLSLVHFLLILQFGCIAWTNLLLFSWFDYAFDQQDEQSSFVTIFGHRKTYYFLNCLFVFNFFLTLLEIVHDGPFAPIIILLMMNITLLLIFVFKRSFSKHDVYRLIGDAIFLFPIFFLIIDYE
jgi:hypothetical protein